ncbi:GNAT family N-acetyltransferase [Haloarchaeobius sp. TZWWS8]|uniref:GNAT family N-acetyltransferase n=1 Tax=Haloarchaeobius sp. TZWWS8 TaxID=3446121 RepID=UPI003EB93FEE
MRVRRAREDDREAVEAVLDAAMLQTDHVEGAVSGGDAFVAVEEGRVLGAAVLVQDERAMHVDAIAVRPNRRGQGIGSALVEVAAAETDDRLTAAFDETVRPFYESLGFEVREKNERLWGELMTRP